MNGALPMSIASAIHNNKAGADKTQITINLAGALAEPRMKVLVFELGGQGGQTTGAGFHDEGFANSGESIYSLLIRGEESGRLKQLSPRQDIEAACDQRKHIETA